MESVDEIAERLFKGQDTDMVKAMPDTRPEHWLEPYKVTEEDVRDYFQEQGWSTWESLTFDHLNQKEVEILEKAIKAARAYTEAVRDDARGLALIMLAGPVEGDTVRTGYGCGKTTLARIILYATSYYYPPPRREDLKIHQRGWFIESRALMERFADRDISGPVPGRSPLIIDDVGREGTLRFEKRDPDLQLQEKQDRYYTVVDQCYKKGQNLVITSNMSAKELAAFLGGAAWSRLLEMCPPQFRVNMTGIRDMRPLLGEKQGENYGF